MGKTVGNSKSKFKQKSLKDFWEKTEGEKISSDSDDDIQVITPSTPSTRNNLKATDFTPSKTRQRVTHHSPKKPKRLRDVLQSRRNLVQPNNNNAAATAVQEKQNNPIILAVSKRHRNDSGSLSAITKDIRGIKECSVPCLSLKLLDSQEYSDTEHGTGTNQLEAAEAGVDQSQVLNMDPEILHQPNTNSGNDSDTLDIDTSLLVKKANPTSNEPTTRNISPSPPKNSHVDDETSCLSSDSELSEEDVFTNVTRRAKEQRRYNRIANSHTPSSQTHKLLSHKTPQQSEQLASKCKLKQNNFDNNKQPLKSMKMTNTGGSSVKASKISTSDISILSETHTPSKVEAMLTHSTKTSSFSGNRVKTKSRISSSPSSTTSRSSLHEPNNTSTLVPLCKRQIEPTFSTHKKSLKLTPSKHKSVKDSVSVPNHVIKVEAKNIVENVANSGKITPDSELEELMLSLDESNTYSPSKQSNRIDNDRYSETTIPNDTSASFRAVESSGVGQAPQQTYYYFVNVRKAMDYVLGCPIDGRYFNADDIDIVANFYKCNEVVQMLYLRLLFRQHSWIPTTSIRYKEIPNIPYALTLLKEQRLVEDNRGELPLATLLEMLPTPKLKKVCKDMKLADTLKRADLIRSMVDHCMQKTQRTVCSLISIEKIMLGRVKKELPECYKLLDEPRDVFMRILMLYSLVFENISPHQDLTPSQLIFSMLREAIGQVKYPQVQLSRVNPIFLNRDYVVRRRQLQEMKDSLDSFLQKKNFKAGLQYVDKLKEMFKESLGNAALIKHDSELPYFLRRYTSSSLNVTCLMSAAEILEKLKKWVAATDVYRLILGQNIYNLNSRGHCYDRLALIYDFHIKDKAEALLVIKEALNDKYVRVGHRLSLFERLDRIRNSLKKQKDLLQTVEHLKHEPIQGPPTVTITGAGCSGAIPDTGRRNVFIHADDAGRVTARSVESVALDHYMSTYNLSKGMHRESSVFTTMFGLLFWDLIYKEGLPDTFISEYQHQPLDFQTDLFYETRKEDIDLRLQTIRSFKSQDMSSAVEFVWTEHYDKRSVCVDWSIFTSASDAVSLMLCLGTPVLAAICDRLVKNYRFCRSGFPDLTMWNPDTLKYKIVEVKGPHDKLSSKQILWLDYFMKINADAEVCHVQVGSREVNKKFND